MRTTEATGTARWHPAWFAAAMLRYLLYLTVACAALHVFMSKESLFEAHHDPAYAFEHIMDGTAGRPFAYRQLMPSLVNSIHRALPEALRSRYEPTANTLIQAYARPVPAGYWSQQRALQYLISFSLMAVFGFATLLAVRWLILAALPAAPGFVALSAPLGFGLALPLAFMNGGFLYDFAELFFLFACLAAAFSRRNTVLLLLLLLAIYNKESNILLVPFVCAISLARDGWRSMLMQAIALAIPAFALFGYLMWQSHLAPGSMVYQHLGENLLFWSDPQSWFGAMSLFVPLIPFPRGLNLVLITCLGLLVFYHWREKPAPLRALLIVSAAINLPLLLLFSWKDETRNLFLMAPALVLCVTDSLWRLSAAHAGQRLRQ